MFGSRSKKSSKTRYISPTKPKFGGKRRWSLRPKSKYEPDNDDSIQSKSFRSDVYSDIDSEYQFGDDSERMQPPPPSNLTRHRSEFVKPTTSKAFEMDRSHRSAETHKISTCDDLESCLIEFTEDSIEIPTITINEETHVVEVSSFLDCEYQTKAIARATTATEPASIEASNVLVGSTEETPIKMIKPVALEETYMQRTDDVEKPSLDEGFEAEVLDPSKSTNYKALEFGKETHDDEEVQNQINEVENLVLEEIVQGYAPKVFSNLNDESPNRKSEAAEYRLGVDPIELPNRVSSEPVGTVAGSHIRKLSRVDAILALSDRPPLPPRPEGGLTKDEAKHENSMDESSRSTSKAYAPKLENGEPTQKDHQLGLNNIADTKSSEKNLVSHVESVENLNKTPSSLKLNNQEVEDLNAMNLSLMPSDQRKTSQVTRDVMGDDSSRSTPASPTNEQKKRRHIKHASLSSMTKSAFASIGRRSFDTTSKGSDIAKEGSVIPIVEKRTKKTILTTADRKSSQVEQVQDVHKIIKIDADRKEQDRSLQPEIKSSNQEESKSSTNQIIDYQTPKHQAEVKSNEMTSITLEQTEQRNNKQEESGIEIKKEVQREGQKSSEGVSQTSTQPAKDPKQTIETSTGSTELNLQSLSKESTEPQIKKPSSIPIESPEEIKPTQGGTKTAKIIENTAANTVAKGPENNQPAIIVSNIGATEVIENPDNEEDDVTLITSPNVASYKSSHSVSEEESDTKGYWKGHRSSFGGVVEKLYAANKMGQAPFPASDSHGMDSSEDRADRVSRLLKQLDPVDKPQLLRNVSRIYRSLPEASVDGKKQVPKIRSKKCKKKKRKKNGKYHDIELLSKTSSIDYDRCFAYYFVPTCVRDIFTAFGCCGAICGGATKAAVVAEKKVESSDGWCNNDTTASHEFLSCNDSNDIAASYSTRDESIADRGGDSDDTKRADEDGIDIKNDESRTIGSPTKETNGSESADDDSIADSQADANLMHVIEDSLCGVVTCKY